MSNKSDPILPARKVAKTGEHQKLALSNRKYLFSEKLSDVTLQGSEGISIPAHRMHLAMRSPYFEKMLFGPYAEATGSVVQLNFEDKVLRAVVEYCYTDEVSLFNEACDAHVAVTAVRIAVAADYFEVPELGKKLVDWACEKIGERTSLALTFLAAEGVVAGGCSQIRSCAVEVLRRKFKQNLGNVQATCLEIMSSSVLESILSDQVILVLADEIDLFRLIKAWVSPTGTDGPGSERNGEGSRKVIASELVLKHIRFENISPLDLSKDVASSRLVSTEKMCKAYRTHALAQTEFTPLNRRDLYWGSSNSKVLGETRKTQTLSCKPMSSGKHIWSIKVLQCHWDSSDICLGVGQLETPKGGTRVAGRWVYGSTGTSQHAGVVKKDVFPTYSKDSVITFTLDLTLAGIGRLSAAVGKSRSKTIFESVLPLKSTSDSPPSFVPVAKCGRYCQIRIEDYNVNRVEVSPPKRKTRALFI